MVGVLFPGQGAQEVGMGLALAEAYPSARQAYDEANRALGYDLAHACFEGPADLLTQTDVCQPAILATSVAAWRVAGEHGLRGDVVMGHSLGEFSALVACGSLGYAEALRMVAERGAAMHAAGERRPGTMAALLGVDDDRARALCERAGDVWPANYNCPGQVVASGTVEGVERLIDLCAEERVKATRLRVGGAFHSPLMRPAADRLGPALDAWEPQAPGIPFLSTTTCAVEPPERMREVLLAQLTSPVRFGDAVSAALQLGVTRFVELCPGKVLSGLVRRVDRSVATAQVGTPGDVEALAAVLETGSAA